MSDPRVASPECASDSSALAVAEPRRARALDPIAERIADRMGEPLVDPSVEERLPFGELAVLEGMLTREQLAALLYEQQDRRDRDRAIKLGTLLVREGYLTRRQAKAILRIQREHGPIEGYQLLEHLGSGGMGAVFRALEEASGRELAIKILPPRASGDPRYRARFLREAALLQQLRHEHLVTCYGQGESGGHLYFTMEHVPGETGRARLKRTGPFSEERTRAALRQVLGAMEHYWRDRIVHRDIKPENIMFTPEGQAKLMDLGLSRRLDDDVHITRVGKTLGTPLYISPELARGRSEIDIRSDLYSLGATFYHLACGVPPFSATSQAELLRAHVEDPPPAPRLKNPRLSPELEAILLRLLEKSPDDRFADPSEVLAALDRLEGGEPVVTWRRRRATPPAPVAAVRRRAKGSGSGSGVRGAGGSGTIRGAGGSGTIRGAGGSGTRAALTEPAHPLRSWSGRWGGRPARATLAPIAACLSFALLFALGVQLGARNHASASAAPTPRLEGPAFESLLARDPQAAARQALASSDATLEQLEAVVRELSLDSPLGRDLEARLLELRLRREQEALTALDALRSELIELVDAGRTSDAHARLTAFPRVYRAVPAIAEAYAELERAMAGVD